MCSSRWVSSACIERYSEGLLCVSALRGSLVCVSRYTVTLMCQLCLEKWTQSWWATVTHTGNLFRALPTITVPHLHTHTWHFSSKHICRFPFFSCSMALSWNPQASQKFLSWLICVYSMPIYLCNVLGMYSICNSAYLFPLCVFVH